MNNDVDSIIEDLPPEVLADLPIEEFAAASTDLCLALLFPDYSPEQRDRFVIAFQRMQELLDDMMPGFLWLMIVSMTQHRAATSEELATLGFPIAPGISTIQAKFMEFWTAKAEAEEFVERWSSLDWAEATANDQH